MRIEISNRQSRVRTDSRRIARLVEYFLDCARRLDPPQSWSEVSVALLDDAQIGVLNRQHLGRGETTDVISFRYLAMPGETGAGSGEIAVNVQRAAHEGPRRRGWTSCHELALYLAHGCDHLAGEDDADERQRSRMRRRELRWIRAAAERGLLEGLMAEESIEDV